MRVLIAIFTMGWPQLELPDMPSSCCAARTALFSIPVCTSDFYFARNLLTSTVRTLFLPPVPFFDIQSCSPLWNLMVLEQFSVQFQGNPSCQTAASARTRTAFIGAAAARGGASLRRANAAQVCSNVGFVAVDGPCECSFAKAARQIVRDRW